MSNLKPRRSVLAVEIGQGTTNGGVKPRKRSGAGQREENPEKRTGRERWRKPGMEKWGRGETAEAAEQGGIVSRAKPADVPAEKGIKVSQWI